MTGRRPITPRQLQVLDCLEFCSSKSTQQVARETGVPAPQALETLRSLVGRGMVSVGPGEVAMTLSATWRLTLLGRDVDPLIVGGAS